MKTRVGVDRAPTTMSTYVYTRRTLAEFIKTEFKVSDLAFGQLNEQFIRDYQDFCLEKKRLAMETVRHYLSILKKICRIAYKEGQMCIRDRFISSLDSMLDSIESIVKHYKPHLNGERFLFNNEVSKKLNVSLRTLQVW